MQIESHSSKWLSRLPTGRFLPFYPFGTLEVGDSITLDYDDDGIKQRVAAAMWGKRHGVRLSVTKIDGAGLLVRRIA